MIDSIEPNINPNNLKFIKTQFAQTISTYSYPKEFIRQHSDRVDGLVRSAFQKAQFQVPPSSVCLIAVGGYGRSELAPHSDIDLLILCPSSQREKLSPLLEKILYPLWDMGLEVTCSARSIHECIQMSKLDLYVKTGLIDGRYLDGQFKFFRELYDLFLRKVLHRKVRRFVEDLAKEIYLRHQKYEDPAYILEPNVKEGAGGLRDFQIARWVIKAKYKTDRWDSILSSDHGRVLDQSVQFLWAVRNQLHLFSGRRQDDLTFELQERVAPILGFPHGREGIEEMMREYHLSTQRILNFVSNIIERILSEPSPFKKNFLIFQRKRIDQYFYITRGEVHLLDPMAFKRDPSQLMILFKYCQDYQIKMDFRTEEAVLEALPFVDDRFRASAVVNKTFLSILRNGEEVDTILKKMHEIGLLSRYIPEFSEIEGRVHYDLYHIHPIDIHSIFTVGELRKLKSGLYKKDYPLLSSLFKEVGRPEVLLLSALLHDIGKGRDGDHSLVGAEIAGKIADRMGLSPEQKECMQFLIRHHLFMVETAFRRDLHDEKAIFRFAQEVKSLDRLKMLYLLTFADMKAVGPETLTSWKNTLLMELFLKTSHYFEKEAIPVTFLKRDEMIKKLQGFLSQEVMSEFKENLPDRYLSCYTAEEIAHHIEMAQGIEKEFLLVEWAIENERHAKLTVCTKDRYGLFSIITGALYLSRLNILEAQIHTWENGIAIDTFWVEGVTQELERRLEKFKKDLKEVLIEPRLLKNLLSREEPNRKRLKVVPKVPAEVRINNQDSDFYTIIEVTGEDRLGILHEITQTLTDHGCDIHFARVSTLGNHIVDVFYVQDFFGEKIERKENIDHLKQVLLRLLF